MTDPKAAAGEEGRVLPDRCPNCGGNWKLFPPANVDDRVVLPSGKTTYVKTNCYRCIECEYECRTPISRSSTIRADTVEACANRPVAWRCKDYADGWIIFQNEEAAYKYHELTDCVMQGLYVRDGALSTATPVGEKEATNNSGDVQ